MKELLEALSEFQKECPPFVKNIAGYGYTYTGLPEIVQTVTPLLAKRGLVMVQRNISSLDTIGVETHLYHIETGQELVSKFTTPLAELKGMNLYQSAGAAITYARRYDMSTLLGLQSEKDDDGGTGKPTKKYQKKKVEPVQKKEVLTTEHEKFDIMVGWIKDGGKIEKIKEKYSMDDATEKELLKRAANG